MNSVHTPNSARNYSLAFILSIPIGILGGLIGLGGAEFRLPVLIGLLKLQTREAVPINLAVSLITLLSSTISRLSVVTTFPLVDLAPILISMVGGAMTAAFFSVGIASKISNHMLEKWIKVLLISIGMLLIFEGFIPEISAHLMTSSIFIQVLVGISAGVIIGIVSSLLGVAGGELIIPTLIFIFGIGVKIAGTASLMISLPTVMMGLIRYYRTTTFVSGHNFRSIVLPMGFGSILGSIIGGLLFGLISPNLLKLFLGLILIYSAMKMFVNSKASQKIQ